MGKRKDLNDFEKGQIVMARRLGQSISQTAGLVGCSRYAVVSTYQKWSKEGQPVNRRQGHGRPRLIDARGERRLTRLVRSHRRATVAQIAEKVNAGFDRKVSEHTVHRSLLRLGLRNRRPGRKRALEEDPGQERVSEPPGQDWSGERTEEEEDQEEEEHHYYQPLNLEPDGGTNTQQEQKDEATHADLLQERIEAMGLFLPQPPAPDSDEEEDPEGAAACRSHASIPMDSDHVELVNRTMAAVNLPSLGIPAWARALTDDQFFLKHGSTLQYKSITSLDNTITWRNKAVLGKANLDH